MVCCSPFLHMMHLTPPLLGLQIYKPRGDDRNSRPAPPRAPAKGRSPVVQYSGSYAAAVSRRASRPKRIAAGPAHGTRTVSPPRRHRELTLLCEYCRTSTATPYNCPCRGVVYCGTRCQVKHWEAGHRDLCKAGAHTPVGCLVCGSTADVMQCACRAAVYCGVGCQLADFNRHRRECGWISLEERASAAAPAAADEEGDDETESESESVEVWEGCGPLCCSPSRSIRRPTLEESLRLDVDSLLVKKGSTVTMASTPSPRAMNPRPPLGPRATSRGSSSVDSRSFSRTRPLSRVQRPPADHRTPHAAATQP